jgi:hypothetical protein
MREREHRRHHGLFLVSGGGYGGQQSGGAGWGINGSDRGGVDGKEQLLVAVVALLLMRSTQPEHQGGVDGKDGGKRPVVAMGGVLRSCSMLGDGECQLNDELCKFMVECLLEALE